MAQKHKAPGKHYREGITLIDLMRTPPESIREEPEEYKHK